MNFIVFMVFVMGFSLSVTTVYINIIAILVHTLTNTYTHHTHTHTHSLVVSVKFEQESYTFSESNGTAVIGLVRTGATASDFNINITCGKIAFNVLSIEMIRSGQPDQKINVMVT